MRNDTEVERADSCNRWDGTERHTYKGECSPSATSSYTQDEPTAGVGTPPVIAFKHVGGRIWSEHDPYFVLSHARKTLVFQMEDGRKFKFFHRDLDGSIGLTEWIG